jgi:DnaJ homolog subfamily C member 13
MRVVKSLRRGDESVAQLALELVCALMVPLHQAWDIRQEQLNKASLLSSPKFLASLLDMWAGHVVRFPLNIMYPKNLKLATNAILESD